MNWTTAALWTALALSGLAAGALSSRWNRPGGLPSGLDRFLLASAAAAVVAWFSNAGALLSSSAANALLTAFVPIEANAGLRLAVLWSTLPGAALTIGVACLVCAVLVPVSVTERTRFGAVLAATATVSLGVAAWFAPRPGTEATTVLPFLQSPFAAIAPLCTTVSLVAIAVVLSSAVVRRTGHGWMLLAWTASTTAIALEQVARSQLGVGPREGIVLGSASGGLVLWLLTSAFMHRRVRSILIGAHPGSVDRVAALAAHVGAVLLALSFAAHAVASRSNMSLAPGQSASVNDAFGREWGLANQGVSRYDADGADITAATIEARHPGGNAVLLAPEIRDYHRMDGSHLENVVSVRRSTGRGLTALRLLLVEADSLDATQLRITFQPVPQLWLVGVALLLAGSLLIATNLFRKQRTAAE